MIELSIRRFNGRFVSYEYRAKVTATTRLSERKQKKLGLEGALGVHEFVLKTPVADIDFMVEMAMRQFSVQHLSKIEASLDDIDFKCAVDPGGDGNPRIVLSALLSWMNDFGVEDDDIRESVVELRHPDRRMLLLCIERGSITAKNFTSILQRMLLSPDETMVKLSDKLL